MASGKQFTIPAIGTVPGKHFVIVSMEGCEYCTKAKDLLRRLKLPQVVVDLSDASDRVKFKTEVGIKTLPQIYLDGERVGGFSALRSLLHANGLLEE